MYNVFDRDDRAYLDWLAGNPDGYVINRRRGESLDYLVLHRSQCRSISHYASNAHSEAFTGGAYLKVCAHDIQSLSDYTQTELGRQGGGFTGECSICRPRADRKFIQLSPDDEHDAFEALREGGAPSSGFLDCIRTLLRAAPAGLTPQEIRRLIKARYPSFFDTESHRRNVARGHYADADHALLAQIYSSCRTARDISIDRSTKPLRYRIDSGESGSNAGQHATANGPAPRPNKMVAQESAGDPSVGFDLERARNTVVKICMHLWRATQEGDPPRVIAATVHHLRTCELIPYVTASLMLTVCAIRNASVYSEWRPSTDETAVARYAFASILSWWRANPLWTEDS